MVAPRKQELSPKQPIPYGASRIYSGYYHCNSRWASHHRGIQSIGKICISWFLRWVFYLFACLVILIINQTTYGRILTIIICLHQVKASSAVAGVCRQKGQTLPDMELPEVFTMRQDLDHSYYCSWGQNLPPLKAGSYLNECLWDTVIMCAYWL